MVGLRWVGLSVYRKLRLFYWLFKVSLEGCNMVCLVCGEHE